MNSFIHGSRISRGIAALIFGGLLLSSASVRADQLDDILKQSETQFSLRSGMARGRVLGREGDKLKMQLREVPFEVRVEQVSKTPAQFLAEARRLIAEGEHRRAAVQYALGRMLDPQVADPSLEQQILSGIELQKREVKDFRSEREKSQQQAYEKKALEGLAQVCPGLFAIVQTQENLIPSAPAASPTTLDQWQSAVTRNTEVWQKFRATRDSSEDPATRLRSMQALMRSLPPMEKAREEMKKDSKRLDSIISMFVYADANLWIDRLQYEQAKQQFEQDRANKQDPMEKYRLQAREFLLEKLVPSKRIDKVRRGNLWEEKVVPLTRNPSIVEALQPRLQAEFIEERRSNSGFYFVTTEGDEVFVPVGNWAEFDAAQRAASPEESLLKGDRIGWQNFKKATRVLAMALADAPSDADRQMALQILQTEATSIYSKQSPSASMAATSATQTTQP